MSHVAQYSALRQSIRVLRELLDLRATEIKLLTTQLDHSQEVVDRLYTSREEHAAVIRQQEGEIQELKTAILEVARWMRDQGPIETPNLRYQKLGFVNSALNRDKETIVNK